MLHYEIYKETLHKMTVEVRDRQVEAHDTSIEKGIAVRVIKDGRLGFAYSTNPDIPEKGLIKSAEEVAKYVHEDSDLSFPYPAKGRKAPLGPYPFTGREHFFDPSIFSSLDVKKKIEMAKEMEKTALSFDKKIKRVRKSAYDEIIKEVIIQNSNGVNVSFSSGMSVLRITAIAEDKGNSEWAGEIEYSLDPNKLVVKETALLASKRAVSYLGSKKISSRKCPAVIDRKVAVSMLEILSASFLGDAVFKKRSRLSGRLGQMVYSDKVTIINDGLLKDGLATVPYDAEGSPSLTTVLVDKGRFTSYLCDTPYGKKLGINSTGSSVRDCIRNMPKVGIQNLYIKPGTKGLDRLLSDMDEGFYITDVLGIHTANPVTSDFSIGAIGLWVEKGETIHGVKGVTIAGNLHDLFGNIICLADDLKFFGGVGSASFFVPELAVSGW